MLLIRFWGTSGRVPHDKVKQLAFHNGMQANYWWHLPWIKDICNGPQRMLAYFSSSSMVIFHKLYSKRSTHIKVLQITGIFLHKGLLRSAIWRLSGDISSTRHTTAHWHNWPQLNIIFRCCRIYENNSHKKVISETLESITERHCLPNPVYAAIILAMVKCWSSIY